MDSVITAAKPAEMRTVRPPPPATIPRMIPEDVDQAVLAAEDHVAQPIAAPVVTVPAAPVLRGRLGGVAAGASGPASAKAGARCPRPAVVSRCPLAHKSPVSLTMSLVG